MGNLDCAKDGDASFLIPLPFGKRYQVAAVHIVPGQKNRITWLTESPFNVLKIVHANKNFILFLAATKPTESHLYRLDSDRRTIYCLTCKIVVEPLVEDKTHHHHRQRIYRTPALRVRGEAVESTESAVNDTYLKISKIKVSDNGLYFTTEFYSGYEPLGGSAMKEAPTRLLINQLTGQVTEASEQDTSEFVPSIRIDQDVGIGLWHIAEGAGPGSLEVHLVWHSHLLIVNENEVNDSIDHQNMTNDPNGDGLTRAARSPLAQLPNKMAKQHHILESTYKMKVKPKFLNAVQSPLHLLHPPAPFGSRPVSNLAIRTVNFSPSKAPETTKGKIDLSASFSNQEVVKNGALLRIWFPPYLNERHLRLYPLLLNIRSKYGQQTSGINHLMDELIILISGSLDVIVMEVQCWLGTAASLVDRDGMNGEVQNYHTLLKLLSENYHYIERNRSAIIGFQGANAHVAGMLVGSEKAALNPKCGALISPVVSWRLHEYTEAIRIFGAVPGIKHLEYDLTRQVKRYRNSEILIVHGTADRHCHYVCVPATTAQSEFVPSKLKHTRAARVPFSQTMKLVDAMAQENIDFSLLPLFDEDHTYRDVRTREAVLRRIATFLFDCLHHSPNDENRFHAVWTSNLEKASSSTEF
ncbi:unnamed protein product [Calicophoron daubneyi]|uniref:Peptidase S9 prolyl oligopeptidase catalytic domain-containing protein n=1 Tax=Calicophoron daubneyi TaxID=300641 RepID=A0AAV2SWC8_CALDB